MVVFFICVYNMKENPEVVLMVNQECNIKCAHCYLPYTGNRNPENTIDLVRTLKAQGYNVTIAGSETLLDPRYLAAYREAGQDYILTNGLLLLQQPSLFELMKEYGIREIRFSSHFGLEKELKSVPEEKVAEVVNMSRIKGFKNQVSTTITSHNYLGIEDMCDKSYSMGADAIKFIRYVITGRGKNNIEYCLNPEQVQTFFGQVEKTRIKYTPEQLKILIHGNFGPKAGTRGEELAANNEYCPAGITFFTIDPQDNVYGCPFLMEPHAAIGKLVDGKITVNKELFPESRGRCLTDIVNKPLITLTAKSV